MKIFCCCTPPHRVLFENFFRPSLPANFELAAIHLPDIAGSGDFLSHDFLKCVRRKVQLIVQSLEREDGELIVWSDVDVMFLRPVAEDLRELMARDNLEIAFQRESAGTSEVNTGFFICRANPGTAAFFRLVIDTLERYPAWNEQIAVNHLLRLDPGICPRWGHLPPGYYARTHGWPPPHDLALYHANETPGRNGVARKIIQFKELQRIRRFGALALAWSCLTKIPKRLSRICREQIRLGPFAERQTR